MGVRHGVVVVAAAVALGIALFLVATAVGAGDLERGRLLYSARCVGCHDKSVHVRESRKALTIEGIRAQVRRWDAFMGGAWGQEEVDDVATYLNDRYYKFPCPPALCPEKRAAAALAARGLSR
jgi:mono/diheme cytochrome c family protein